MVSKKRIPQSLQPLFWSRSVKNLEVSVDKNYIIHQVLRYGDLQHIKWLFSVYEKSTVVRVFKNVPAKIYSPASLNFITRFIIPSHAKIIKKTNYIVGSSRSASRT